MTTLIRYESHTERIFCGTARTSQLELLAERLFYDFNSTANTATLSIESGQALDCAEGLLIEAAAGEAVELRFKGAWDFSDWIYLSWDIDYRSESEAQFDITVEGKYAEVPWGPQKFKQTHSGFLKNKETRRFDCTLVRTYNSESSIPLIEAFKNMNAYPNGLSFNHNGIIPQGVKAVTFRLEPSETTRKLLIRKIIDRPYAALSLNGGGLTSYFLAVRAKPDCQRLPLLPA